MLIIKVGLSNKIINNILYIPEIDKLILTHQDGSIVLGEYNSKSNKFSKIKEASLLNNHLYIFQNCKIKFDLNGQSISIRLQCSDAKSIMPCINSEEVQDLPILEDGLFDYEKERIKRRVN